MLNRIILISVVFFTATAYSQQPDLAPVGDHHQHIASPSMGEFQKFPGVTSITAKDVIALLDTAGIKKGVLLSIAYSYGRPGRQPISRSAAT